MEHRGLKAIMFTDIAGYTALMGKDEHKAVAVLKTNLAIHKKLVRRYNGHIIKEIGDGILASFDVPYDSVLCAMEIQQETTREAINLRIGIHLGEVIYKGKDIIGDGVNIASRLESIAGFNSIIVSDVIYNLVKNKTEIQGEYLGEQELKNVSEPVKAYQVNYNELPGGIQDSGFKKEKFKDVTSYDKTKILWSLGIVIFIVILFITGWKYLPGIIYNHNNSSTPVYGNESPKSIAVLPFKDLSENKDAQILCYGIQDGIIDRLSNIRDLRIPGPGSVEKYRDHPVSAKMIRDELGVDFILVANIIRIRDKFMISLKLINTLKDQNIWSKEYNKNINADDEFSVMSDIATEVASNIHVIITPRESERINIKPTRSTEAFDSYVKGNEALNNFYLHRKYHQLDTAIHYFRLSINYDPRFALAYVGLGHVFWHLAREKAARKVITGSANENFKNSDPGWEDSVLHYTDKALDIDPGLDEGYYIRAWYYDAIGDTVNAFNDFNKALTINPNNGQLYSTLGIIYYREGNYVKEFPALEKAKQLIVGDPLYSVQLRWMAGFYSQIGDYFKAYENAREQIKIDTSYDEYTALGQYAEESGDWDLFKNILDRHCENHKDQSCMEGLADWYKHTGDFKNALYYIEKTMSYQMDTSDMGFYLIKSKYAYVLDNLKRKSEASKYYDQVIKFWKPIVERSMGKNGWGFAKFYLAETYAVRNNKKEVYKLLNEMDSDTGMASFFSFTKYDPLFHTFWNDKKFNEILNKEEKKYAAIRKEVDKALAEQHLGGEYRND